MQRARSTTLTVSAAEAWSSFAILAGLFLASAGGLGGAVWLAATRI